VRRLAAQESEGVGPVAHGPDLVSDLGALEGAPGQLDVVGVVLDEQDIDGA